LLGTHAGTRAIEPWPVTNLDAAGSASIVGGGGHPSPFGSTVRLRRDDAARILGALSQVATVAGPAPGDGASPGIGHLLRLAQAALCQGETGAGDDQVAMGASVALDLAAELLECAELLGAAERFVAAFALEGIEGRLLEALLGAGPFDDGVSPGTRR